MYVYFDIITSFCICNTWNSHTWLWLFIVLSNYTQFAFLQGEKGWCLDILHLFYDQLGIQLTKYWLHTTWLTLTTQFITQSSWRTYFKHTWYLTSITISMSFISCERQEVGFSKTHHITSLGTISIVLRSNYLF